MDGAHQKARIEPLPFTADAGAGERARLGLLALELDQTMEWEFRDPTDLPGVSVDHAGHLPVIASSGECQTGWLLAPPPSGRPLASDTGSG